MIASTVKGAALHICLQPNQSSSWSTNKAIVTLFGVIYSIAAWRFFTLGVWPVVLLFAAELALLYLLLRKVCIALQTREELLIQDEHIAVSLHTRYHHSRWCANFRETRLLIGRQPHPWDAPPLALYHHGQEIPLGRFLPRDDCESLIKVLRDRGMVCRHTADNHLLLA